jgi:LysR family transcriptional regulator, cell division regulator
MDLNSLRIFLAVADEGSVSRAAEKLHYVQSNITARLRALEAELGADLFYRKPRGMSLTPRGDKLLAYARKMLHLATEAKNAMSDSEEPQGALTLGSMETTAAIRLPQLLADFHQRFPQVDITLRTGTSGELRQQVLDYRLDGAFVGGAVDHPELVQEEIFQEEMVLVSKTGCSSLDDADVRALLGFRKGCSYQAKLEEWLRELGKPAVKIMEFGSLEAILGCVAAGMGVTLMPKAVIRSGKYAPNLQIHPVPERFARIPTMFIRRRDMTPSAPLDAFLDRVRSL